jgi:hypothetical protein
MLSFTHWTEEAKKKKSKQPMPTTPTSAPLRGQNQDQSGYNGKNSVADYTISDEKINELSPELVGKVNKARLEKPSKTTTASKTLSAAVRKAWLKTKVGVVKEMIAGVGAMRIKPVNMAHTTGGKRGDPNAPSNLNQLQNAANKRVAQLDKAAQQQKELQKKTREDQTKQRQNRQQSDKPGM